MVSQPQFTILSDNDQAIRPIRRAPSRVPPLLLAETSRCCRARDSRLPSPAPSFGQDKEGYEERPRRKGAFLFPFLHTHLNVTYDPYKMIAADGLSTPYSFLSLISFTALYSPNFILQGL